MAKLIGIATHPASKAPIEQHQKISVTLAGGLDNDFQGKNNPKTQVTLLSLKTWQKVCASVNVDIDWTERRANLLVDDMDFNESMLGQQIQVGKVLLQITSETDPCARMDALHSGLKQALTADWAGGIRCTVLREGKIYLDDSIILLKRL
ncbi:MAG: hypothetical protein ISEC1_P1273 [Thiomicrorhabdus sp.]|nr:MAG: hypothetical protein ISEC1_P1273 [Thiomicrorhabdus sp.]